MKEKGGSLRLTVEKLSTFGIFLVYNRQKNLQKSEKFFLQRFAMDSSTPPIRTIRF